jgi:hypothetical protein
MVTPGGESVKTEADVFPELYQLWLTVEEFPCQNLVFKNARLLLHRPDTEERACDYDFAALIRGYDTTDPWMEYPRKFIVDELFTRAEEAAIEAYLAKHQLLGITVCHARQMFPIPKHWAPCSVPGYGAWEGEYRFDAEEGFDCPVKFWGRYWLGETPIVAGLAQILCEPDGSLVIEGLGSPSTLRAHQADRLWQAWRQAQARGRAERVTVRYDLPRDHPLPVAIAHAMAQARLLKGRHMGGGPQRLPPQTTR